MRPSFQIMGTGIAARYVENASGASSERSELRRLLEDASTRDILLAEAIDHLIRLPEDEWECLRVEIEGKRLRVVALDLPTGHAALSASTKEEFSARMLDAVNWMMLDMVAAIARKDHEQGREHGSGDRQVQTKTCLQGLARGSGQTWMDQGFSYQRIKYTKDRFYRGGALSTVQNVKRQLEVDNS